MSENIKPTEKDAEALREDISGLKNDVREMERILMEVDAAEGQQKDQKELKDIDRVIDEL